MNGIETAFVGRCAADAEEKTSRAGKTWLRIRVAVNEFRKGEEEPRTQWVSVAYFGQDAAELAPRVVKGAEVYCEGRLSLDTWTGQDGVQKSSLSVASFVLQILGEIGRKREKPKPADDDPSWF